MKRLRFYSPFHGHYWPLIAAVISAIAAGAVAVSNEWPAAVVYLLLLSVPIVVLAVSYIIIQMPSRAEREMIANAAYPLWVQADEKILRAVKDQKQQLSPGVIRVLIALGLLAVSSLVPKYSSEPEFGAAIVFAMTGMFVLGADMLLRHKWQSADQSALMTVIPIDHRFDIKHSRRFGNIGSERWEWFRHYLVFYLPDGRYVLPAGANAGYAEVLIIVQYNGMYAWIPCAQYYPKGDKK